MRHSEGNIHDRHQGRGQRCGAGHDHRGLGQLLARSSGHGGGGEGVEELEMQRFEGAGVYDRVWVAMRSDRGSDAFGTRASKKDELAKGAKKRAKSRRWIAFARALCCEMHCRRPRRTNGAREDEHRCS